MSEGFFNYVKYLEELDSNERRESMLFEQRIRRRTSTRKRRRFKFGKRRSRNRINKKIKNFKIVNKNLRLSHKLVHSFNELHHRLESQFLCVSCNGISIKPLFCKRCGCSYCERCFLLLSESEIKCLCIISCGKNFVPEINHELFKTNYWVQDKLDSDKKFQISYLEAISYTNRSPFLFISIEHYDLLFTDKIKGNNSWNNAKHASFHNQNFNHRLALKIARLFNFHHAKTEDSLRIESIELCQHEANFLGILNFHFIKFYDCKFNLDFSLNICKCLKFNVKRIKTFSILGDDRNLPDIEKKNSLKTLFIILNALQFCSKIKKLRFKYNFNKLEQTLFPKSFYNFLSNFYNLKKIQFRGLIFYDYLYLNPFKSLISLQTLSLEECSFQIHNFLFCILDNIPNLNELILDSNKIINNSISTNIFVENLKLKKLIKFPHILRIHLQLRKLICFENLLMKELIQCDKIKIKYIQIHSFDKPFTLIPKFLEFLECSNLKFLILENFVSGPNMYLEEFCNYLQNSIYLMVLSLKKGIEYIEINFFDQLFQAISVNKSIKVLSIENFDLYNLNSNLINLILANQYIATFLISNCEINIDSNLIDALSKSKSLLYLCLPNCKINKENALQLAELNLKGINVEDCEFDNEKRKELIYEKIPKKNFPGDFLFYENL